MFKMKKKNILGFNIYLLYKLIMFRKEPDQVLIRADQNLIWNRPITLSVLLGFGSGLIRKFWSDLMESFHGKIIVLLSHRGKDWITYYDITTPARLNTFFFCITYCMKSHWNYVHKVKSVKVHTKMHKKR